MTRLHTLSLMTVWLLGTLAQAQQDTAFVVHGRVVDGGGKPVAGATVRMFAPGYFHDFEVNEKTVTDAQGKFSLTAPMSWTRMDATSRQELAVLAAKDGRLAVVQFNRSSAPPRSTVELTLAPVSPTKVTVLTPDLRPVAGAKVKLGGLNCDTIRVDLTEAQAQMAGANGTKARKVPLGYVLGRGMVSLPPDLVVDLGVTDAQGQVTVSQVAGAMIGALSVQVEGHVEQTIGYYPYTGSKPAGWPGRVVLARTGRIAGQLASSVAGAVAKRHVTVMTFEQNNVDGIFRSSSTEVVSDADGRFDVPEAVAGTVACVVKFDPARPTRPPNEPTLPPLKAGATVSLKLDLKPAVRVEGRVLDADSRKPLADIRVRAYRGTGFEAAISDAAGKFGFWMPPGETAFHPDIPDDYLPPVPASEMNDPNKRLQRLTIFKVPEAKTFEAPPVLLRRAASLRGVVVNEQGEPLADANISGVTMAWNRRDGGALPHEITARTDARGEFALKAIDPRESLRLRVTAKTGAKILTLAKPGTEVVRIVLSAKESFSLSGSVADAEGRPVAEALLEIWHRDWRPGLMEAEPKKLNLEAPLRADVQGRFQTPLLPPDGFYRFTIRAAGAKTADSAWLDATKPEALKPQLLVVTRLGGLAGVVRNREGQPIPEAQVFLFAHDARTSTNANKLGEFKLEVPAGKPFCVVVRHPEFRVGGRYYDKNPASLDQTLVRLTEPDVKLPLRTILAKDERARLLQRLLEPLKQQLAKSTDTMEKVRALQSLTGPAPDFVIDFLDKNPLKPPMYCDMLLGQVAIKNADRKPDEAEELIGRMPQGAQQTIAYGALVDGLPESARARKLEILAEALVSARAEKAPEFRAIGLGQVAKRLYALGEKDRAAALLREGQKIATGLSSNGFAGYARGCFATDLAPIDLPAALALMKDLKDRFELPRHHGNTAHRLATLRPADAVKVLDLIPPPGPNEFNQRDQYAIRVCYRMAQVDPKAALQLAESIIDVPSRAHALGVIAQAVAAKDAAQVPVLVRRAFTLLEEDSTRPDSPQLTGPHTQGAVAAALLLIVEQADPTLLRECLWRAVALQRPNTEDPQNMWRFATGNSALALAAARYDARLAEFLLPTGPAQIGVRETQLARFLASPRRTIEEAEKAPRTKGDRDQVKLISYVATPEDRIPRLIFSTLGIWPIDVEDIDF